ncbi:MAG TPA: ADOP family duplicated permease [Gemmatimonadaceae bacterium]|nr:ADOP family duplicated permease [Gemmatimonadaceae bacterium]
MRVIATLLESVRYDLGFAVRGMRRRPGFTAIVVATLALGIGANTTMFGILDRLLFRAPPYIADPGRVLIFNTHRLGSPSYQTVQGYGLYRALEAGVPDFASMSTVTSSHAYPEGRGISAGRVAGSLVSGTFWRTLGVRPAVGRFFEPEEERVEAPQKLAVISYGFWQRRYAGRRQAIGQILEIGTGRYTIVGVAPRGFTGTELSDVDVWLPITAADRLRFDKSPEWATTSGAQYLQIVARLRPGVTAERAAAQATSVYRSWRIASAMNASARARALVDSQVVALGSIIPGRALSSFGLSAGSAEVKTSKLLAAVAVLVLLIACANVANLLLVRSLSRRREIAVRLALGVGRRRLMTQLLMEGVLLALAGAAAALGVAAVGTRAVRLWLLGDTAASGGVVNPRVLAFTALVALLTGILTSLVPALETSRPDLASALKSGSREGSVQRSVTRTALLVTQAALAIVMLAGAGLFIRSLRQVAALNLGLDVDHVLVAQINSGSVGLSPAESRQLFDEFAGRANRLPGVHSSAVSVGLPFSMSWGARVSSPGRELPTTGQNAFQYAVTSDYFETMGIRLVAGRLLTKADRMGTAPVMLVNEALARIDFPGTNPVGTCLRVGADTMPCTTIVGVVTNTRRQSLVEEPVLQVYRPLDQLTPAIVEGTVEFFGYNLVVRATGDAAPLIEPLRRMLQATGSQVPYADVRTMRGMLASHTRGWVLGARVFTAFGALALVLAAVGLFSVVAFTTGQRMHEFGVRSALGAQPTDLLRLAMARGLAPAAAGIGAGVAVTVLCGRFVAPLLFQTSPYDPTVLSGASAALLVAAVVASVVPAMRATKVDPTIALRAE